MTQILLQIAALVAALALGRMLVRGIADYRRRARALAERRAGCFDALSPRLTRLQPSGFARAALTHQGHDFDLQLVPDALSFRKLPCLWLLTTLTEAQPLKAETRIMARASGLEPFSTFADMPFEVALPPGFTGCTLRTTDPSALPDLAPIAALFADPKVKELTLSPKGLRLVTLAEEAPRTAYLLYREAALPERPLDATLVRATMERLCALAAQLKAQE